jgi:hypothetical protein
MPNTTNFNWPTPADTDLVKDGAAAIRNLGNGVDTSLIDLKGGTTGQILSKASNADMDFAFITPNVGDLTEVQAGTGISVADGTGPIPVITNTVATAFDAAGDLIYGTGADTFTKLSLGTAAQVLTVNSGATAPEWVTPSTGGFSNYTTYTPTWTNLTVGNGTVSARYTQDNKVVIGTVYIQFGSTTSITSNNPRFTLPVTARDPGILGGSNFFMTGAAMASDWNNQTFKVDLAFQSTTAAEFLTLDTGSAHGKYVATTTTVPITFGTSDVLMGTFIYEAA